MPFRRKGRSVVGIRDATRIKQLEKGSQIVGAERDMTAIHRIDHFAIPKRNRQVAFGKMHLHGSLGRKADFPVKSTLTCRLCARKSRRRNIVQTQYIGVEFMHFINVF